MNEDYIKLDSKNVAGPYLQGVAFLEGVITVVDDWKKNNLITLSNPGYRAPFLASNIAFSIEMFLKTTLNIGQIKHKHTHDLSYLFNLLPNEIKDIIKSLMKKAIFDEQDNKNSKYFFDKFEFYLNQNKDVFPKWRYYYEKDNQYTFEFLYRFSMALYKYLNDYHDLHNISQSFLSTFTSEKIEIL